MAGIIKDMFKPKVTPQQQLREWQRKLRQEQRNIDRSIRDIQREEMGVKKAIREAAKRNDMTSAKHLAKELVRSKKAVARMHEQKAQMNSICLQLGENVATSRVVGTLSKSTEVMKLVNGLVRVPELSATMMEMSKEMLKAGIVEEMVNDGLDSALDSEDMEEETEEEVNKVLEEMALETSAALPAAVKQQKVKQDQEVEEDLAQKVPGLALSADDEAELASLKASKF